MKNIITLITIVSILSCKAQTVIIPLENGSDIEMNPDYYLKDVNNILNKFEGTWKYQNGTSEITVILKKEEHYGSGTSYYRDLLVGEYQYIEGGNEKVNTLADIDNPTISVYQHKIFGKGISHSLPSYCVDNSDPLEKKIRLSMKHPTDEFAIGRLYLRHVIDAGIEKLEMCLFDKTTFGDNDIFLDIPDGSYTFIKQ